MQPTPVPWGSLTRFALWLSVVAVCAWAITDPASRTIVIVALGFAAPYWRWAGIQYRRDRMLESAVSRPPERGQPVLSPGWPGRLVWMIIIVAIGTLFLQRSNGHWPFN